MQLRPLPTSPRPPQFQHRGSVHCHGFIWLRGAPDVRALMDAALSDDELAANAHLVGGYFARLVQAHAINRDVDTGPDSTQPCSREFADVAASQRADDLAALQMRLQLHTCTDSCMRDGACRFLSRGDWSLRCATSPHSSGRASRRGSATGRPSRSSASSLSPRATRARRR